MSADIYVAEDNEGYETFVEQSGQDAADEVFASIKRYKGQSMHK